MKLEKQVVSLELAEKLKALGVKQESLFWWVVDEDKDAVVYHSGETTVWEGVKTWVMVGGVYQRLGDLKLNKFSAFTVAELGEMLPKSFQIYSYPTLVNGKETWDCTSSDPRIHTTEGWELGQSGTPPMLSDTEADARAKMLIYLLENKLFTPPSNQKE